MTKQLHTAELDTMAWTIDRDGIDTIATADLRELAAAARRSGVHPAVADVLVDPAAPVAPRVRAFGLIARHLARPNGRHRSEIVARPSIPCAA